MKSTYSSQPSTPKSKLGVADLIAIILMIIGAINWGLVGAFNFDLVAAILGSQTVPARVVYVLVGLAGLYGLLLPARLHGRQ